MREIKFKIWDDQNKIWATDNQFHLIREEKTNVFCFRNYLKKNEPQGDVQYILCQSTGLKDKNGKEIYELSEIDGMYRVVWLFNRYVLESIANRDIFIEINEHVKYEITGEYCPIPED